MGEQREYRKLLEADERLQHARSAGDGPFAVGFLRDSLLSHPDDPRPQARLDELGIRYVEPTLGGHADNVTAVAWTPGGELIVTGSLDGRVKVWDAQSGTELWTAAALSTTVNAVAVSPSGALLAAGSGAGEIALCRLDEPGEPFIWSEPSDCVCCLAFTPSGKVLGAGCRGGAVRVFFVDAGACRFEPHHTLDGHPGRVEGLAWLPGTGGAVTLTHTGVLRVYRGPLGQPPFEKRMHPDGGDGVHTDASGELLATWSNVGTEVHLWRTDGWGEVKGFRASGEVLRTVAVRPDGGGVFAALASGGLLFWDVAKAEFAGRLRSVRPATAAAWSPDSERLALGLAVSNYTAADADVAGVSGGGFTATRGESTPLDIRGLKPPLIVIDPKLEGRPIGLEPGFAAVQQLAFSPDGQRLACALYQSRRPHEKCVRVFGVDDRREVLACGHSNFVTGVAFSPDGARLAAASLSQFVRVWSATLTGDELAHLKTPLRRPASTDPIAWAVAFTPDGARLLVACEDERVRLVDPLTGEVAVTFGAGLDAPARLIGMSRDGSVIAAGALTNNRVLVFRAAQPEVPAARVQHGHGDLLALALSSSGERLASSRKGEGVIRLWDAATGEARGELTGHSAGARGLAFSPDGALLASASDDGSVRLWEVDRRVERRCVRATSAPPRAVVFSPDGRRLAIGGHEIALVTV